MFLKKSLVLLSLCSLVACGPTAPLAKTPTGTEVKGDKGISGSVTGTKVDPSTKVAVFGAFMNVSGNRIDTENKTIEADTTLAVVSVNGGKYSFALPKAPQKAQAANLKIFAFNDANGNNMYDEGETKSKEASVVWSIAGGYVAASDADGNKIVDLLSDFKDIDFKLE